LRLKQLPSKLFKELVVQVKSYSFEQSLLGQVGRLASQVERQLETVLKDRFDLSFSQFRVLVILGGLGETSQRPIVDELGLSAAMVTRQLELLVTRGLVAQKQSPTSRRENAVRLTAKGERAVGELTAVVKELETQLFERLGLAEETALSRTLTKLAGKK
jgi:DNA-binding MarR family transcriptional regulator